MSPLTILLVALGLFTVMYVAVLVIGISKARGSAGQTGLKPTGLDLLIGAVTNFFDTLGIGSFAPTTSMFRYWKTVPDERIPGTLNVGHTLPTIAEAFIYITIIQVDFQTLGYLIGASVVGSWLGAGIVARWPRRRVQVGMGYALLAAAALFVLKNIDEMRGTPLFPGGDALGLHGTLLGVGIVGAFMLGALMTLGIGLYAPCMIMIALLGMSPKAAVPIMMGACAFLMPVSSARFIKEKSYDLRASMGLMIGGVPAVLLAAFIVKSLPLTYVRWLVVVVVLFTAVSMLRTAMRERAMTT
jgi:uncharacterized membrane protein YfcA